MKVKLLKMLRAKFIIEYFPSTKQYKVHGENNPRYFNEKVYAEDQRDCNILNYGRRYYEKYSKRIRIQ